MMLHLDQIDLDSLGAALEFQSGEDSSWWLESDTGEVFLCAYGVLEDTGESIEDLEARGAVPVEPVGSDEGYRDMESFIAGLEDGDARTLLERAIRRGRPFRRFKDTLFDFPELREQWFTFHDGRLRRRAIEWLVDVGVVDPQEAQTTLEEG